MRAKRSAKNTCWPPCVAIGSIPAPTSSMSTFGGFAPSSAARRSKPYAARGTELTRLDRWPWPSRRWLWIDIAWGVFALLNLVAIFVFANWETVPFHFIWVSLTILYGFRVWRMRPTLILLGVIILATGGLILIDILRGAQPLDEITEVPLSLPCSS